jgi:ABC-2 type transport system permease protein
VNALALTYRAAYAEAIKGVLLILGYRFANVGFLGSFVLLFVGSGMLIGNGRIDPDAMQSPLLGYMVWFFGMKAVDHMAFMIQDEASTGTLEQMYMSPAPLLVIMIGRSIGTILVAAVQAAIVAVAIVLIVRLPVTIDLRAIVVGAPIFALTMVGLFGFGFVVAGLSLVFKRTGTVMNMLQTALLYFSGVLLPLERLPEGLAAVARTLPSTQGIVVMRQVVFDGLALPQVWADGSLPWLIVHSALYFTLGWIFYAWCESIAKRQGSLGQY